MPETYTVKITSQAQEQLRDIVSYIRYTLQSPETAIRLLHALEEEIYSLEQFPNRIPLTAEKKVQVIGISSLTWGCSEHIPPAKSKRSDCRVPALISFLWIMSGNSPRAGPVPDGSGS